MRMTKTIQRLVALRHWLQFWQLRTSIGDSVCENETPDSIRNSCNFFSFHKYIQVENQEEEAVAREEKEEVEEVVAEEVEDDIRAVVELQQMSAMAA